MLCTSTKTPYSTLQKVRNEGSVQSTTSLNLTWSFKLTVHSLMWTSEERKSNHVHQWPQAVFRSLETLFTFESGGMQHKLQGVAIQQWCGSPPSDACNYTKTLYFTRNHQLK